MNSSEGWISPKEALSVLASACTQLGVIFHSGPSAAVTRILSNGNIVEGVCTEDGTVHSASIVVLAAGAWSETLLDFERQLVSVTYGVCQLQLTQEERRSFSSFPVVLTEHSGDWFPPNNHGIMKGCDIQIGITNLVEWPGRDSKISVPRDPAFHPTDTLPIEHQMATRNFLRACLPDFSERQFLVTKVRFYFIIDGDRWR
jgi:sarcosine oxidase/L-pipecolate oxidase